MEAPLTLRQGDEPALEVACQVMHADGTTDPIDLTGATVRWVSKPRPADPDAAGVTITGTVINRPAQGITPTSGRALVQITSAVTAQAGRFAYKVVVVDTAGHPATLRWGPLVVEST